MSTARKIMFFENFAQDSFEKKVRNFLLIELYNGVTMIESPALLENTLAKAEYEMDRLIKKSEKNGSTPIIKEFVPEILQLVKKFSESGQSGGSAPFTTSALIKAIEKLLKQEPLGGIENSDDEWGETGLELHKGDSNPWYQNKRLSSVFKEGKDGKPYYIDAIVFKDPKRGLTFTSNSVDLKDPKKPGAKIGSSHYIKKFPFEPKTFVIDVDQKEFRRLKNGELIEEEGGGWWESSISDPKQLEEVWKYYDRK